MKQYLLQSLSMTQNLIMWEPVTLENQKEAT